MQYKYNTNTNTTQIQIQHKYMCLCLCISTNGNINRAPIRGQSASCLVGCGLRSQRDCRSETSCLLCICIVFVLYLYCICFTYVLYLYYIRIVLQRHNGSKTSKLLCLNDNQQWPLTDASERPANQIHYYQNQHCFQPELIRLLKHSSSVIIPDLKNAKNSSVLLQSHSCQISVKHIMFSISRPHLTL